MSHIALYRTYRPLDFSQVIGQQYIVKTLQNAIKQNKVGHAYLFAGPRGTGKTSMARILAKALNCTNSDVNNIPCNKCENCLAINEGNFEDVIEIDGASNNKVDDIRELIDRVKYPPMFGKYKVYIIDEVHVITSSAFNALLKTLEEPPKYVVFILATTDPQKVIETIQSRCQRFDFGKVEVSELVGKMKEILKTENINFEEPALKLIATLAEGGVRDALSSLQQVISYSPNNVGQNEVKAVYGIATSYEISSYLVQTFKGNVLKLIEDIDNFEQSGIDFVRLTIMIHTYLKELVLYKKTKSEKVLNLVLAEHLSFFNEVSTTVLLKALDILLDTQINFKKTSLTKDIFVLATLKISELVSEKEVKEPLKEIIKPVEKVAQVSKVIEKSLLEKVVIEEKDILNILVQAVKTDDFMKQWNVLSLYKNRPNYSKEAYMLLDFEVAAVSSQGIILKNTSAFACEKFNSEFKAGAFEKIIEELFKDRKYIVALSEEEFKEIRKKFVELRNEKKLPKPYDIFPPKNAFDALQKLSGNTVKIEVKK